MTGRNAVLTAGMALMAGGATVALLSRRSRYSFENKSVLITGASRGLGLLMARLFAEEGARLTILSRHGDDLSRAARELSNTGAEILTIPCDVRDRDQAREAVETAVRVYGSIDVLINNAGVITVGPVEEMDLEDFETAMATHAFGPLYTMLAAIPHMKRQSSGRIVNISSIGGKIAVPHLVPYAMSKFALAGLSDGMRAELHRYGIFVTSVYPGLMRTGSHVFAQTRGDHEREAAWFSLLAVHPLFAVNATRAARQIIESCRRGRQELIISAKARLAEAASGVAPGLIGRMSAIVNRFILPKPAAASRRDRSDAPKSFRPAEAVRSTPASSSQADLRPAKIS